MKQDTCAYFCSVVHDTPLHNPHLAGLCEYFLQFDHRVIGTSLNGIKLILLITSKYVVDKDASVSVMKASIKVTDFHYDDESDSYNIIFKDKEHELQEMMVTMTPVRGTCKLTIKQEDGEEVQL